MRLVCISDKHGDHEGLELPAGDVLIHAGDLSAHGQQSETLAFMRWLGSTAIRAQAMHRWNHDRFIESEPSMAKQFAVEHDVHLLNDSGYLAGGLHFWGSPITPRFFDWAFMRDPGEAIDAHWRLIPPDTDVLITHGPPFGIMDEVERPDGRIENTGCPSLLARIHSLRPQIHIFGHIHEGHGFIEHNGIGCYNVSTMDEHYRRRHPPVVIEVGTAQ